MVVVVFYISGHGFGHASRQIELIREICAQRPDVRVIVRTSVPRWLFAPVAGAAVEVHTLETDTGVVQFDSLSLDEEQTVRNAARFFADFDRRIAVEAEFIRGIRANLVVGDIPPLAFAAAERAGVPGLAIANFTWDWIAGMTSGVRTPARRARCGCRCTGASSRWPPSPTTFPSSRDDRHGTLRTHGGGSGSPVIGRSC